MNALDTGTSQVVVKRMVDVLGTARAIEVLGVRPTRLDAFLAGRGRLAELQLNRIAAHTRRTWILWGMDSVDAAATTAEDRAWVASAQELRDLHENWNADEVAAAEQWLARAKTGCGAVAETPSRPTTVKPRPARRKPAA